jgi:transposase
LSSKQKQHLAAFIENHTTNPDGGRLIAEDIRQYIQKQFGVEYQLGNIYRLLKEIGLSWITSRSRHPKQSLASQDVFKKVHTGNDPSHPF